MDKVEKKTFLGTLLLFAFTLLIGWKFRSRNFYYAMDICEVLILPFLYIPGYSHPRIIPFVFLLSLELYVQIRLMHKRKHGYGVVIAYAAVSCWIVLSLYRKCEKLLYSRYFLRESEISLIRKELYILAVIFIISVFIFLAIRCIGIFAKKWLQTMQEYSMKYREIDRSVMLVMSLTFCCLMMTELIPMSDDSTYALPLLWIGLCTVIVMIQIIYIQLLVKSISVKEEMRLQENDLHQLAQYNRELENNMKNIRNIKHDIKNLFLTMGGFVDKSGDEEMKVFYTENIVPFANQELQKNDLYMKLSNVMEEAKICSGTVMTSIKENEREYVFSISNTVRRQTRKKGVIPGTTDKGLGRGNGLLIVNKLIRKYKNVLLNSFFKEEQFVQCLRIEKL